MSGGEEREGMAGSRTHAGVEDGERKPCAAKQTIKVTAASAVCEWVCVVWERGVWRGASLAVASRVNEAFGDPGFEASDLGLDGGQVWARR